MVVTDWSLFACLAGGRYIKVKRIVMGLSLQEQLLKTGVADKKQARKAAQEKREKRKKKKIRSKGQTTASETNQAREKQLAQARRSREIDLKRNREKQRQERVAQVRQLIQTHRLKLDKYEDPYYFKVGKKIKKLYVNDQMAQKLSCGQLAVALLDDQYEIVPGQVARQILDRDPGSVILWHTGETEE
jgi:uncharacterized protein YaiL (DUF2058 family)